MLRSAGFQTATAQTPQTRSGSWSCVALTWWSSARSCRTSPASCSAAESQEGRFGQNLPVLLLSSDVDRRASRSTRRGRARPTAISPSPSRWASWPRSPTGSFPSWRQRATTWTSRWTRRSPARAIRRRRERCLPCRRRRGPRRPAALPGCRGANGGAPSPRRTGRSSTGLRLDRGPQGRAARRVAEAAAHAARRELMGTPEGRSDPPRRAQVARGPGGPHLGDLDGPRARAPQRRGPARTRRTSSCRASRCRWTTCSDASTRRRQR